MTDNIKVINFNKNINHNINNINNNINSNINDDININNEIIFNTVPDILRDLYNI